MADMAAVNRAAGGGAPAPAPGGAPAPPPQAGPAPGGGGPEEMVALLEGVNQFIDQQAQQGNPAAQQAKQALMQLVQSLQQMAGGAPGPEAPPPGAPASQKVPDGSLPNAVPIG